MLEDNRSPINWANGSEHHKRTKHIDVRYHYVRDMVNSKDIVIQPVFDNQSVDVFTKPLSIHCDFVKSGMNLIFFKIDYESSRRNECIQVEN